MYTHTTVTKLCENKETELQGGGTVVTVNVVSLYTRFAVAVIVRVYNIVSCEYLLMFIEGEVNEVCIN